MNDEKPNPFKDVFENVEATPLEKRSLFVRLRNYFIAGMLVTAPIAITLIITLWFLNLIDSRVRDILSFQNDPYQNVTIPGLGIVIAIVFFIFVGWLTRNYLGQLLLRLSEYLLDKMPIVRTIYSAIKQIFETVMTSKSQAFRDVVMLEYPRKGIYSLGFLTGKTTGEVEEKTHEDTINVFVPTTPNPTSGFLLFVPRKDVTFLDMTVEEGIKMVVSAGIITPEYPPKKRKSVAEEVEKKPAPKKVSSKKATAKKTTAKKAKTKN